MVEKLSITVGLEGGKELERQLADIGLAGQKAFLDISKAAEQAGGFKNLKPEEVTQKLKDMGITGQEAIGKITAAVQTATRIEMLVSGIQKVERGFAALGNAAVLFSRALGPIGIAAAFVGTKVVSAMNEAAKAIGEVDKQAINLGTSIEKLDQLRLGFEKMGLSAKAVSSGIDTLQKNLDSLDVARIKQAFEQLQTQAGAGLGSQAMKTLQDAAQGVGKAADDARLALTKLADQQRLKSLQTDLQGAESAAARAQAAFARLAQVPDGTPGKAQEMRRLGAAVENATIAVDRARQAVASFAPSPAPLTGVAAAFERLGIQAGDVSQRLPEVVAAFAKLPDSAQRSHDAILLFGQAAGTELIQSLRNGGAAVDQFVSKQGTLTQKQADNAAAMDQSLNKSAAAWERFKTTGDVSQLGVVWNEFVSRVSLAVTQIGGELSALVGKIRELAASIGGAVWDTFAATGTAAINTVSGALDGLIKKINEAAAAMGKLSAGGGAPGETTPIPGNAAGGLIGGRGTGTSDSNLAWVSRGEHIMPARAVAQPGVLAFLEALRRSGGDLGRVLNGLGRFATGGLVAMPAFASGGLGGMSHVTIAFPGLPAISGLRASSDVVEELRRSAAMAQVRSGGRKPSRYT